MARDDDGGVEVVHHPVCSRRTAEQTRKLRTVLAASGLDAEGLSIAHAQALAAAVARAELALRRRL
ncbi:hypothetical protein ACFRCG_33210 [Embleya sp. NPDC056575]|uniref:hypothetical protein n=1 Tax=unclassified Embleya TaxID=2699296 RepID=UPI0036BA0066